MQARRRDNYEKHRAPARAPRAGVNGGSAPDSNRQIKTIALSHGGSR